MHYINYLAIEFRIQVHSSPSTTLRNSSLRNCYVCALEIKQCFIGEICAQVLWSTTIHGSEMRAHGRDVRARRAAFECGHSIVRNLARSGPGDIDVMDVRDGDCEACRVS